MRTICFKHRATDCACLGPINTGYVPAAALFPRKSALEVYYSCKAFAENTTYTPAAVALLAQQYLTAAGMLSDLVNGKGDYSAARKLLKEAGFEADGQRFGNDGDAPRRS